MKEKERERELMFDCHLHKRLMDFRSNFTEIMEKLQNMSRKLPCNKYFKFEIFLVIDFREAYKVYFFESFQRQRVGFIYLSFSLPGISVIPRFNVLDIQNNSLSVISCELKHQERESSYLKE